MKDFTLDRREFTVQAALAMLSGVVITISGCGGSGSDGGPTNPNPASGDMVGTISANHGHSAVITGAELTSGNALLLSIKGTSTHDHIVSLSAAEITTIANRQRVSKESNVTESHSHTVTFN